jgi:hypothetical protein
VTAQAFQIEAKSAPSTVEAGPVAVVATADPHEYSIIGSVTGVLDEVGDVVVPGAFKRTLTKRIPKIIEAHDWARPIGKVLEIKELLPGDSALPATTSQGQPWPKGAGALVAKVRLFKNPAGEAAKVRWDEYGADQQFSIGYKTQRSTKDPKTGTRYLHVVDLFEVSDVLWGAMPLAGPMPAELAAKVIAGAWEMEVKGGDGTGVVEPDPPEEPAAEAAPPPEETPDTAEYEAALCAAAQDEVDWDEVDAAAQWEQDGGAELAGLDAVPAQDPAQTAPAGEDEPTEPAGHTLTADELAEGLGLLPDTSEIKRRFTAHQRDGSGAATGEGVKTQDADESKAAGGADQNRGNAEKLRVYWTTGPGAAKVGWGTPGDFDRCVTLLTPHMGVRAKGYCNLRHQDVLGAPPGKGHGKGLAEELDLEIKLEAWDPYSEVGDLAAALDVPEAKAERVEVEAFPGTLEERRDAVRDAVNTALRGARVTDDRGGGGPVSSEGRYEWDYVSVQGTWPDQAVVTRRRWVNGMDESESFVVPYSMDGNGTAVLGEPVPVSLEATIVPAGGVEEPVQVNPALDLLDDAAYVVKSYLATEGKAGRMLSGRNSKKLQEAVETLLSLLQDAGVNVTPPQPPKEPQGPDEPVTTPDTTSVSATTGTKALPAGMVRLGADELAEGLELLAKL